MRLDEIFKRLSDDLDQWARGKKAQVSVARDPYHPIEVLSGVSSGLLLMVAWAGDEPLDLPLNAAEGDDQFATRMVELFLGRGIGLEAKPDRGLIEPIGGRDPLYKTADELIARALAIRFEEDGMSARRLEYRGAEPVTTPEGMPLRAMRMKFGLVTALNREETRDV